MVQEPFDKKHKFHLRFDCKERKEDLPMRESSEWTEILRIKSRSQQIWNLPDKDREQEENAIVDSALTWISTNPSLVLDVLNLSMGGIPDGYHHHRCSPLLLEALGRSRKNEIISPIEKRLQKCRRSICLHSEYLMKALMLLETSESYRAIAKLVKTDILRRRNYLISDFIDIMNENLLPGLLPILLDITRKTGIRYKVNFILARLADAGAVSFENLLQDKSSKIRFVAVEALRFSDEKHLNDKLLENLSRITRNKKDDLLCRSYAADILKERGHEVPSQFRDRPWENISSDVERFVRGILYPEERPDDWAMTEILEISYSGGKTRIRMRASPGMIFVEPYLPGKGFWRKFTIGFNLVKAGRNNEYLIRGIGLAIQFERGPFEEEYLIHNLDRVMIAIADDLLEYSDQNLSP